MSIRRKLITAYRRSHMLLDRFSGRSFPFNKVDQAILRQTISTNRQALTLVDDWVPSSLLENSVFNYGVNPDVKPLLNLPVDAGCTHTDLLAYFGRTLKSKPVYLELGVSVGKTLWQIMNVCAPCECWAFDIEEINTVIAKHLVLESRTEWPTKRDSIKKTPSSISRFMHAKSGTRLVYICADIFDERAWELMAKRGFNLVLSDALHLPEALDFEWQQITQFQILDRDNVAIMWDDVDSTIRDWFEAKRQHIAQHLNTGAENIGTFYTNGWLGNREFPHRLGLAIKR